MTGKGSDTTKIRCVQLSPTYAIASFAVSDLRNFKQVKTCNILEMRASFVTAGVKRQTKVTEE
jgi:hypothetical protein